MNAKLNVWERFFKGSWKTNFEARYGAMKQAQFEQLHLHNSDIGHLALFLDNEIDTLELQVDSEVELQFARDLLKQLPPIQEKDCWFLFQKKVEIMPLQAVYGTQKIDSDFKKENANGSM